MQLYSRRGLFVGPFADVMGWATRITNHASDLIGAEIALWSPSFGAPTGTLAWALPVSGLAGVASNTETMTADARFHELLDEGRQFSQPGSVEDSLMSLAYGELTEERPPIGAVAVATSATMQAPYADVMAWGVDVAQMVEEITGMPVLFGVNLYGAFTDVGWISVGPNASTTDEANEKLRTNADYLKRLGEATELFVPGSGNRMFMTRVG